MDINTIFESLMAVNLGIGLSVIFILQLCKFLWRSWLTEEDIRTNAILTIGATVYSFVVLLILVIAG